MKRETHDTKQKLLDTASRLIWENSYGAVSVDDICTRAGVKKGSFYHFFPSKADLAVAALEQHWQQSAALWENVFSPKLDPRERLLRYAELIYQRQKEKFDAFGKVCGCPFASLGSEQSTQDEKLRQKTEEIFQRGVRYLEATLRDATAMGLIPDQDIAAKAQEVFSYVMGTMVSAKVLNDLEILKRDLKPGIFRIICLELPASEPA